MHRLTKAQARRIAVRAQLLDAPRPTDLLAVVQQLTLLQIAIGIVDLTFCSLAMYMLVPDEPNTSFVAVAVIFVSATLLGFASAAPGGIGVFDAAMLVALWQYDKEELLAGLLLFRLIYYVVPFALSLGILGIRELLLATRVGDEPISHEHGAPVRLVAPGRDQRTPREVPLVEGARTDPRVLPPTAAGPRPHRPTSAGDAR